MKLELLPSPNECMTDKELVEWVIHFDKEHIYSFTIKQGLFNYQVYELLCLTTRIQLKADEFINKLLGENIYNEYFISFLYEKPLLFRIRLLPP